MVYFARRSVSRAVAVLNSHRTRASQGPFGRLGASNIARRQVASMDTQPIDEQAAAAGSQWATKPNSWSSAGPAAFDFRSDVVTTPTTEMLNAIASTSLLDDVFVEDTTTNELESFISKLTNFEAAVLVLSGTMGNQLAIRTHLSAPPHAVLSDARGHVMTYEAGGIASLSGAFAQPVRPSNNHHLTLEDVKASAVVSTDVHACPTRIISLENTLNGMIMPLDECRRISEWARDRQIIMHLDGARLWEAVAAGAGSLQDYCACFDSVSLCFSKGLGAPIGSILVGSASFIKRARWVRKSIGGGLRQSGVIAAPAKVAVESTFLGNKLKASHENAKNIARMWQELGGKLAYPTETNMVWLDVSEIGAEQWQALAAKHQVRLMQGRLVVHYQIGAEGIERLAALFREALGSKGGKRAVNGNGVAEENVKRQKS